MATFDNYEMSDRAIMLLMGDSGAGKTSLIASVANAGYKVRVADFENKLAVLNTHLTNEGKKNLSYISFKDELNKIATAAKDFKKVLAMGWKDGAENFGKIETWGTDTIFVIDSLSALAEDMKHEALAISGRKSHEQLQVAEWGEAIRQMTNFLDYVTSDYFRCHILFTALPQVIDDDSGISRIYPAVVTKNFSTQVGRYFDNVLRIQSNRKGERSIRTCSDNKTELKILNSNKFESEIAPDLPKLIEGITYGAVSHGDATKAA